MYGDIAHGFILFLGGCFLFTQDTKMTNSKDFNTLLQAKYLILFMGMFSVYCGFIYNDFMSLPLNLFGSCWDDSDPKLPVQK